VSSGVLEIRISPTNGWLNSRIRKSAADAKILNLSPKTDLQRAFKDRAIPVLLKESVEQYDVGGQMSNLSALSIIRAIRRTNQQAEYERSERRDESGP
jgi:hypothetical protein